MQQELEQLIRENAGAKYPHVTYVPQAGPAAPHRFFRFGGFGIEYVDRISPDQQVMYWGGTISAIGIQVAIVMGAECINLYGCSMDKVKQYAHQKTNGFTEESQVQVMQATIDKARTFGVNVGVVGKSRLC